MTTRVVKLALSPMVNDGMMMQALPTDCEAGSAADAEFDWFADVTAINVCSAVKSLLMLQERYSILTLFVLENEDLLSHF